MQRKLVKQGTSTLMVSLPSKWVQENGLKKGDDIDVEEKEGKLILGNITPGVRTVTIIELSTNVESSVRNSIVNAYRAGYDEMRISFPDEIAFKHITRTVEKYLIGFDIIERHTTSCVLANISEPASEQATAIFNKIFTNISYIIHSTIERLEGKHDFSDYDSVIYKTYQYDNFCRRVISKHNAPITSKDKEFAWDFLGRMLNGVDEFLFLNWWLDKNPVQLKHKIMGTVEQMFTLLHRAYTTGKITHLEELHQLQTEISYDRFSSDMKTPKKVIPLYHILVAARMFYLASSPLTGLLIRNKQQP